MGERSGSSARLAHGALGAGSVLGFLVCMGTTNLSKNMFGHAPYLRYPVREIP